MGLPLSQSSVDNVTGQFELFFQQMSVGRNSFVSIVKQPLQVINNPNSELLAGYGPDNQNIIDISYIPETGIFPCVTIYPRTLNMDKFASIKFQIDLNQVLIKVKEDARDFILNGTKTERVYVDNMLYIPQNTPVIQNFFGLKYYYFKLNEVQ